jgi:nitrogenase molybdenum-iron protein alpha/beta subunit
MLNFCGFVVAILKMVIGRNCSMSGINSGHHYLPTYNVQNGYHNTAQIQHGPISTTFHMWVDYDVQNLS